MGNNGKILPSHYRELTLQRAAFGITQGSPAQKSYDVSSLPRANQKQIREGRERGHTQ